MELETWGICARRETRLKKSNETTFSYQRFPIEFDALVTNYLLLKHSDLNYNCSQFLDATMK